MKFVVMPSMRNPIRPSPETVYLLTDNWNDFFQYQTMYFVVWYDSNVVRYQIGEVKIGQFDMEDGSSRPNIPVEFEQLGELFFSIGQDDKYYENINRVGDEFRIFVLQGLRDFAFDNNLYEKIKSEQVTTKSLLRSINPASVVGQYHRMALGGARLSRYRFDFVSKERTDREFNEIQLLFDVIPESNPPSNIHVIIGRNGVGKTRLLKRMTDTLIKTDSAESVLGTFSSEYSKPFDLFANLVSVTFSAFDPFEPQEDTGKEKTIQYSYIGLKAANFTAKSSYTKGSDMLADEFMASVLACVKGPRSRRERWQRALQMLESDPNFDEADVTDLATVQDDFELKKASVRLFEKLSSGHKIVLLTITRLVETVEERTLVLLDEPEAHLHPPLLSALIRSLSDLLTDRNGVAIVATHSPVVLQEVPTSCVWKLRRVGSFVNAERPQIETFGENVGVLTREIFGLEVTHSGFHKMLKEAVAKYKDYEMVISEFNGELGAEAKAIVRALLITR